MRSAWIFMRSPAHVRVQAEVPAGVWVDVEASSHVGDVALKDVTVSNATIESDVGEVKGRPARGAQNLDSLALMPLSLGSYRSTASRP